MNTTYNRPRLPLWPCMTLLVLGLVVIPFDGTIAHWAATITLGGDIKREFEVAQQFGDVLSLGLVAILIWTFDPARRAALWFGAASVASAGIFGAAAKCVIGRPRPKFDSPAFLGPWGTYDLGSSGGIHHAWEFWRGHWSDLTSMPSNHTLFAAALAAFLAFAYPRLRRLVIVLTVTVALARVLLRSHYPSEVLIGAAAGWFVGTLGMQLVHRVLTRSEHSFGTGRSRTSEPLVHSLGA